jgi:hypothetical protein
MRTAGGVVTKLWTVQSCHDRTGLQWSKVRASDEGCGAGGAYATAPPPDVVGE